VSDFPPIAELIPHSGPAVLLDRVVEHNDSETTCLAVVDPAMQYVRAGRADAALALELMAQAVAVHVGLKHQWSTGVPRAGYVVGVPRMDFFGGDYHVGERLEVFVRMDFHEGPVGRFEGRISCGGKTRAEGSLTVFEPPLDSGDRQEDDQGDDAG
jgi:predicted hotdog family 3-hydroxylacyl-ACP dehydratase